MATRFYLPNGGTVPNISPAYMAGTGHTPAPSRSDMAVTRQNTALATETFTPTLLGFQTTRYQFHKQFVGPSMPAQTISGTFSIVVKCSDVNLHDGENLPTNPWILKVYIHVVNSAGVIGPSTLYQSNFATYSVTPPDVTGMGMATTLETRIASAIPLTSYTCAAGDRLVVSIGGIGDVDDNHNISHVWGDPSATVDHTLVAGQTMVGVPWIEFSQDLFPVTPPKAGSATFNALWSTSAIGKTSPKGSAVASMSWAISAIGESIRKGAASVNTMWSTTVVGKSFRKGASSVDVLWSALVIGKADYKGLSVFRFVFTTSALGTNAGPHNVTIMVALLPRRWSAQLLPQRWLGSIQPERRWKGKLL